MPLSGLVPALLFAAAAPTPAPIALTGGPWAVTSVARVNTPFAPPDALRDRILLPGDELTFTPGATLGVRVRRKGGELVGACNLVEGKGRPAAGRVTLYLQPVGKDYRFRPFIVGAYDLRGAVVLRFPAAEYGVEGAEVVVVLRKVEGR